MLSITVSNVNKLQKLTPETYEVSSSANYVTLNASTTCPGVQLHFVNNTSSFAHTWLVYLQSDSPATEDTGHGIILKSVSSDKTYYLELNNYINISLDRNTEETYACILIL